MFENYVDVTEASKVLRVHPETVKRLIREGKLPATKFGNKWVIERDRLQVFANTYDGRRGRVRRLLRPRSGGQKGEVAERLGVHDVSQVFSGRVLDGRSEIKGTLPRRWEPQAAESKSRLGGRFDPTFATELSPNHLDTQVVRPLSGIGIPQPPSCRIHWR